MLLLPLVLVRWFVLAYRARPQSFPAVVNTNCRHLLPQLPVIYRSRRRTSSRDHDRYRYCCYYRYRYNYR